MDDYCKNYVENTLCVKVNMHVSKFWCESVCKGMGVYNGRFEKIGYKNKDEEMPPLSQMVRTFNNSIGRWIKSGFKIVDRIGYVRRTEICRKCKERIKGRCKKCGCNIKMKLALATEKCPMNYW